MDGARHSRADLRKRLRAISISSAGANSASSSRRWRRRRRLPPPLPMAVASASARLEATRGSASEPPPQQTERPTASQLNLKLSAARRAYAAVLARSPAASCLPPLQTGLRAKAASLPRAPLPASAAALPRSPPPAPLPSLPSWPGARRAAAPPHAPQPVLPVPRTKANLGKTKIAELHLCEARALRRCARAVVASVLYSQAAGLLLVLALILDEAAHPGAPFFRRKIAILMDEAEGEHPQGARHSCRVAGAIHRRLLRAPPPLHPLALQRRRGPWSSLRPHLLWHWCTSDSGSLMTTKMSWRAAATTAANSGPARGAVRGELLARPQASRARVPATIPGLSGVATGLM